MEAAVGGRLRRWFRWRPTPLVFPSYGRIDAADTGGWFRLVGRVLVLPPDVRATTDGKSRGWRRYVTISVPGVPVTVEVGGHRLTAVTASGGYLDQRISVDLPVGRHDVRVTTADGATGTGALTVIDPAALTHGVISDIDDTVVVTILPRPLTAFWNTFVLREGAREPVPGMAAYLHSVNDGLIVYLSTGAWNYAPVIRDFLLRTGFPDGALLMTDWGPTFQGDEPRLFRSGVAHKESALRRLHAEFPELTWTLVGDDGQHDPVIYDDFAAACPGAVDTIAIRTLTAGQHVLTHGTPTAPDGERLTHPKTPASQVQRITGDDGHALLAALPDT